MQGRVVCLSRHGLVFTVTALQAISGEESLPGLCELGSQGRHQTRRFTAPQESSLTPRMSRKCPKMSKPSSSQVRIQVAARFTGLHYLVAPQRTIYVVHA